MEQYKRIDNDIIIDCLMNHYGIVSDTAKELSIHRQTLSKWIKEDVELQKAQIEARENLKDFCEGALIEGIKKGQPILTIFALKCLAKDRGYIDTNVQQVEITSRNIQISFEPQNFQEFQQVMGGEQVTELGEVSTLELPSPSPSPEDVVVDVQ